MNRPTKRVGIKFLKLYLTTELPEDSGTEMYYWVRWEGDQQASQKLPLEVVDVKRTRPLKKLLVDVICGIYDPLRYPRIIEDLKACGINSVTFSVNEDVQKVRDIKKAVSIVRSSGLPCGSVVGWGTKYFGSDEQARAVDINGAKIKDKTT